MVLRISYVKIPRGIKRHAPRVAKSARFHTRPANDFQGFVIVIKYLNSAVAKFAHILPSVLIDTNIVRITQLALACAWFAVSTDEFPAARKNLNPMIAGIRDINPVVA